MSAEKPSVALIELTYVHPLPSAGETLPTQFTNPFRYTPHPLCERAARIVQEELKEKGVREGKMYGVLVCSAPGVPTAERDAAPLYFLAAYSGQLGGSYTHPWFVPPIVDYLDPESHFQREQREIMAMGQRLDAMREDAQHREWQQEVTRLRRERDEGVAEAKRVYEQGRCHDTFQPGEEQLREEYIRLRQFQKANIRRAKQLYWHEISELEERLTVHNATLRQLAAERRQRSEALQQWLFRQFDFLNGAGESKNLLEIFCDSHGHALIPSGAGECCAPKLLQTAFRLGLQPLAMGEFWWGPSSPQHYRQPGAFFPACHRKCRPILGHMLRGLNVESDRAQHYEQAMEPVRVVWEDAHLAIIFKPCGWCSIPGRSNQDNLFDEAQRRWPGIEGSVIVHRLDQDTSGVMVLAKTAAVHRALSRQFECREVEKRYVALLEDAVREDIGSEGIITLPLAPDTERLPRRCVDPIEGRVAVTRWQLADATRQRVIFYPQTGRTHQLRVHSSAPEGLGTPIRGDRLYGRVADRLYLHAETISFIHPVSGERMHFEVPCPF